MRKKELEKMDDDELDELIHDIKRQRLQRSITRAGRPRSPTS